MSKDNTNPSSMPEFGTKEFNDMCATYFGGNPENKPKKQAMSKELTAEEKFLIKSGITFDKFDDDTLIDRSILKSLLRRYKDQELEKYKEKVKIECDGYIFSSHSDLPDGRKVIWIENEIGEGTTVCPREIFELIM